MSIVLFFPFPSFCQKAEEQWQPRSNGRGSSSLTGLLAGLGVTVHQRDSSSVNNGKVHLHQRKCSRCVLYYSSLSFILTKGRGAATAKERQRRLLHWSFGRIRSHHPPKGQLLCKQWKSSPAPEEVLPMSIVLFFPFFHFDKRPRSGGGQGATAEAPAHLLVVRRG